MVVMTTSARKTPRARSSAAPTVKMRAAMRSLHACFAAMILDPLDKQAYEDADTLCWQIWEYCLNNGTSPWAWCLDRYCSCKVALSEHEPDRLPGAWHEGTAF